jgi:1-acyl-sn-glycerol-3-phosphate acyltransferase
MRQAESVRAARSPRVVRLFGRYMRHYAARRFHGVRLARGTLPALAPDRPVIVYSNHPSWWDPAMFMILATLHFPERRGYGPMDEDALRRYGFMRRIGIFGIEPDRPRGAAAFLKICGGLLEDPATMLWITAEGRFTDPRSRPISLRPGLAHLARRVTGASIVPLALEYPFWDESTPEALCRFGSVMESGGGSVDAWNTRLEAALTDTMDDLAALSQARDATRFEPLLSGAAGVGGVYDLWRRAKSLARGERFQPEHGGDHP